MINTSKLPEPIEELLAAAEAAGDLRIIRKFQAKEAYGLAPESAAIRKGIVLDTETTGRDHAVDKIIELGMLQFEYNAETGQVYRILEAYNGLEDPQMPISLEATRVNGITDDMVRGQRIDDKKVEALVLDADIIIAHNSGFDRPFMEERLPIFKDKPWGCSQFQIDWESEGIGSRKLDYIAYRLGFFYDAHRAESDCRALLEMLQRPLPISGVFGLKQIIDNYTKIDLNVAAIGSPFETKDLLKAKGYRWDGEPNSKFWHINLNEETFPAELVWLREAVHKNNPFRVGVAKIDAFNRFSRRLPSRDLIYG